MQLYCVDMEHAIAWNPSLGQPLFEQADEAWPSAQRGDATRETVVATVGASSLSCCVCCALM